MVYFFKNTRFLAFAKLILFAALSLFFEGKCLAQESSVTLQLIDKLLKQFNQNAKDSVAFHENLGAELRKNINKSMEVLGYKRAFIFGENDMYFAEGMHKHFTSAPRSLVTNVKRNKEHVKMENNHIRLFYSDEALFRWRRVNKILTKEINETIFKKLKKDRIRQNYELLDPFYKQKLLDYSLLEAWIYKEISCQLLAGNSELRKLGEKEVKIKPADWLPEFDYRDWEGKEDQITIQDLLLASYPMDGQFNFYIHEFIREKGYFLFKNLPGKYYNSGKTLKVRWTDSNGKTLVTDTKADFFNAVITFPIPVKFLKKQMIYRLDLLAAPETHGGFSIEDDFCMSNETFFNSKGLVNPNSENNTVILHSLYFRTSKHDKFFTKDKEFLDTLPTNDFKAEIVIDEPFGQFELEGDDVIKSPVRFRAHTYQFNKTLSFLYNKFVLYYFQVPAITSVDTVDVKTPILAELDHTVDAPFVRNVKLGAPAWKVDLDDIEDTLKYHGTYFLPPPPKSQFIMSQGAIPPKIEKQHFVNPAQEMFNNPTLEIHFKGTESFFPLLKSVQQQLQKRIEDRAHFFFMLHARKRKQQKQGEYLSLDYFIKQEMENLPEEVKNVLDTKTISFSKIEILESYKIPGTEQTTSSIRGYIIDGEE